MEPTSFEFFVSAGHDEVFAWLHGRAAKSGQVLASAPGAGSFCVRWPATTVDGAETVAMAFAVQGVRDHMSRVTVELPEETTSPLAVINDFAGPLVTRMTGLRERPREFFDPPLSTRDEIVLGACWSTFAIVLTIIVATRHIPAESEKMSGREALLELLAPLVVAGFATGVIAGIVARRRSRWFELPILGLVSAGVAAFFIFDFWFVSIDSGPGAGSGSSNFALAIGAALCAAIEAVIVLTGIGVGRIPTALAWSLRRLRRRPPPARRA